MSSLYLSEDSKNETGTCDSKAPEDFFPNLHLDIRNIIYYIMDNNIGYTYENNNQYLNIKFKIRDFKFVKLHISKKALIFNYNSKTVYFRIKNNKMEVLNLKNGHINDVYNCITYQDVYHKIILVYYNFIETN